MDIDYRAVAQELLAESTGRTQDDLHYRMYLREVVAGRDPGHIAKKYAAARDARADLIDRAGGRLKSAPKPRPRRYGPIPKAPTPHPKATKRCSMSLDEYARMAFSEARDVEPDARGRTQFVAMAVGSYAGRCGMSERGLAKWLQSSYGSIFVRENQLDPGLDLKDVSAILKKSHARGSRRK